jgi:hypothetical protein
MAIGLFSLVGLKLRLLKKQFPIKTQTLCEIFRLLKNKAARMGSFTAKVHVANAIIWQ